MTVNDLLKNAVALMGGDIDDLTEYEGYAIISINTMLADLFEIQNALLKSADDETLTVIPSVTAVEDDLTYDDRLTRNVMNYGLARDLGIKDNHPATSYFTRLYDEKRSKYNVGISTQVTDDYADEE